MKRFQNGACGAGGHRETAEAPKGVRAVVTIRDVAAAAGVSVGTASRALSGKGSISAMRRDRVLEAAGRLGYQVDKVARSLRTGRSDILGLLVPDVRNPFFAELAYVIDKAAAAAGLAVITMSSDESLRGQERALDIFGQQSVDGLIVVPQAAAPTRLLDDVPTVFVDRDARALGSEGQERQVPVIATDQAAGMRLLVDHLVDRGHHEIAVLSGDQSTSTGRCRRDGAVAALAAHGLCVPDGWMGVGDFQWERGRVAARKIFAGSRLPSALIAGDNTMAVGALLAAREMGLRVGHDIAVVAFDDAPWFGIADPPLTVVAQDVVTMGQRAVEAVQTALAGGEVVSQTLPARLIVRSSSDVDADRLTHQERKGL